MELRIKFLKWNAGLPMAMINKETASSIGIHTNDRISIKTITRSPKALSTIIDTVGKKLIGKNEIAVSSELKRKLGLRKGQKVDVNLGVPPKSMLYIKKKLDNKTLSEKEITLIIKDIVQDNFAEPEIALFISAMYKQGMNMKETLYLIKAILKFGNKLKLRQRFVVDKHSIGGIPGNRTTPIVVSICATAGLTMPKNSSRAITSAAGTADVIETVAQVEFSVQQLRKILKKTNACMIWGGAWGMVPADSKIIKIEKMLKIDPKAQLLASIMAKKLAVDSEYLVIDIPYGKTAKLSKKEALELKQKFLSLAKYFKLKMKVLLTDGSEPIGNGIGPALELIDVLKILDPTQKGPRDLEDKSLILAGEIFEMTSKAKKTKGREMARKILESGEAYKKFKQIIKAQKGSLDKIEFVMKNDFSKIKVSHSKKSKKKYLPIFKKKVMATKSGKIKAIHNKKINALAKVVGCPIDKFSGLYLPYHVGDKVKKSQPLLTIYSESKSRLDRAVRFYREIKPIKIE